MARAGRDRARYRPRSLAASRPTSLRPTHLYPTGAPLPALTIAAALLALAAPETTITTAPPALGASASVRVEFASDGGVGFACSLDGAAFAACTSPLALDGLADGRHVLQVRALGADGVEDATPAEAVFTIDTRPPAAPRARPLPAITLTPIFKVRYATAKARYRYDVEVRTANAARGTFTTRRWRTATIHDERPYAAKPGTTSCFRARASDAAGNLSEWGAETCTSIPLDDRVAFGGTRPWVLRKGAGYYGGGYTALGKGVNGAFLITGPLHARRLVLLATGCPACGSLLVIAYDEHSRSRSTTISLRRAAPGPVRVTVPWSFDPAQATRLQLLVTGGGRIEIDGLAVLV